MRKKLNQYFDKVILASASPARKEILIKEGLDVTVRATDTNEVLDNINCDNIKEKLINLAQDKLINYIDNYGFNNIPIITCDTVIYHNNKIIGKAKNKKCAFDTLLSFNGKMHQVYTASCIKLSTGKIIKCCDVANVYFKNNTEEEIKEYLDTEEWMGAAGSYRIQSKGMILIDNYFGDFDTIVGLPLFLISDLLKTTLS